MMLYEVYFCFYMFPLCGMTDLILWNSDCRGIQNLFILFAGTRLVSFWHLLVRTLLESGRSDQGVKEIVFTS